jgi:hypothetical protein
VFSARSKRVSRHVRERRIARDNNAVLNAYVMC